MRTIAVVTVGRSDVGIYAPVLDAIRSDPGLSLRIVATGAHFSRSYGYTANELIDRGFEITDRVEMLLNGDSPEAIAKSMGLGTISVAQTIAHSRPDLLLVMGDRFEMHAAALAAVPFRIPIAHIHGGEVTHGAIDDCLRHAITKYSHLHFASTDAHARRIQQLGEEPWRITVSGAPALDNLKSVNLYSLRELESIVGIGLDPSPLLVTFQPVTLQYEQTGSQMQALLGSLVNVNRSIIITKPNADTANQTVSEMWAEFARNRSNVRLVDSLGTRGYFSLMSHAAAMVGNSSSGIIEAASFSLPVVNIGIRQSGRPTSRNVLHVAADQQEIEKAIQLALSESFRESLQGLVNIYGQGNASRVIVERLKSVEINDKLLIKQFHDF